MAAGRKLVVREGEAMLPTTHGLRLMVLPDRLAISQLPADVGAPDWVEGAGLVSVTRTHRELSIVCAEARVPVGVRAERGWRALEVAGPLDFALTGVLAALAGPLAAAGISLFALATYDTDYLLVRANDLDRAIAALAAAGHRVDRAVRAATATAVDQPDRPATIELATEPPIW